VISAAGRTREYRCNPPRHLGAQAPQIFAPPAGVFALGHPMGCTKGVTDRADPREIEFALKIPAVRQQLSRSGMQHRLEADAIAGI
jgi:hypothetical protein